MADGRIEMAEAEERCQQWPAKQVMTVCTASVCALAINSCTFCLKRACVDRLRCNQQLRCVFSQIPTAHRSRKRQEVIHVPEKRTALTPGRHLVNGQLNMWHTANTALFVNCSHFAHDEIEIYGKTYDRYIYIQTDKNAVLHVYVGLAPIITIIFIPIWHGGHSSTNEGVVPGQLDPLFQQLSYNMFRTTKMPFYHLPGVVYSPTKTQSYVEMECSTIDPTCNHWIPQSYQQAM